jgi:hypothetical protein
MRLLISLENIRIHQDRDERVKIQPFSEPSCNHVVRFDVHESDQHTLGESIFYKEKMIISILITPIVQAIFGSLIGAVSGYVGGEVGIYLREQYNKKHPKTPIRNNWGDTEGTYVVFFAFFVAVAFGFVSLCFADHLLWFSSINTWNIGLPVSAAAICAYFSFYTL